MFYGITLILKFILWYGNAFKRCEPEDGFSRDAAHIMPDNNLDERFLHDENVNKLNKENHSPPPPKE